MPMRKPDPLFRGIRREIISAGKKIRQQGRAARRAQSPNERILLTKFHQLRSVYRTLGYGDWRLDNFMPGTARKGRGGR